MERRRIEENPKWRPPPLYVINVSIYQSMPLHVKSSIFFLFQVPVLACYECCLYIALFVVKQIESPMERIAKKN